MATTIQPAKSLDVRGLLCPIPVTKARQAVLEIPVGELLEVVGDDPFMTLDFPAWCDLCEHELVECEREGDEVRCLVRRGEPVGPDPA